MVALAEVDFNSVKIKPNKIVLKLKDYLEQSGIPIGLKLKLKIELQLFSVQFDIKLKYLQ